MKVILAFVQGRIVTEIAKVCLGSAMTHSFHAGGLGCAAAHEPKGLHHRSAMCTIVARRATLTRR
jgi:hypothetical protein